MNLPEVKENHKRVDIVERAYYFFKKRVIEEAYHHSVSLDTAIHAFSQSIVNLTTSNKIQLNDFHSSVEEILNVIASEYELTYGERILMLSRCIDREAKYVLRWERHKDLKKDENLA